MRNACASWLLSAVLAVLGLATTARAADIGQCATPAQMTELLKAEDQHSIVTADMITLDKHLYALIVTMSADRKTGYILKADQPLGDPAKQLCVYNRLADLRLFDARKPGIDPAVLLKAPDSDALRRCGELIAYFGERDRRFRDRDRFEIDAGLRGKIVG